jgi:hypothetical protein
MSKRPRAPDFLDSLLVDAKRLLQGTGSHAAGPFANTNDDALLQNA